MVEGLNDVYGRETFVAEISKEFHYYKLYIIKTQEPARYGYTNFVRIGRTVVPNSFACHEESNASALVLVGLCCSWWTRFH
jgi:hypothetical protein